MAGNETAKTQRGRALAWKPPVSGETEAGLCNFGLERVVYSPSLDFGGLGETALSIYSPDLQPKPVEK